VVTLNKSTEIIPKEEEVKGEQTEGERESGLWINHSISLHGIYSIPFIHSSSLSFDHQT